MKRLIRSNRYDELDEPIVIEADEELDGNYIDDEELENIEVNGRK